MSLGSDFDRVSRRRPAPRPVSTMADAFTGVITRWTDAGAFVAPLLGDLGLASAERDVGPCRGGWVRDTSQCGDAAHAHPLVQLPKGTVVLVQVTAGGTWIARHDQHP